MINLKEMLNEDRSSSTVSHGCLMAMIPEEVAKTLVEFGKKIIPDEDLYIKDGEFGRETESHITIRYGFTKDLTELEIRSVLDNQAEFTVKFFKLDKFESEEFDVIILRCESPIIQKWYELLSMYPNEETFKDYKQHLTIAYVKKGTFSHIKDIDLSIPISDVCYSPIQGGKSDFELKRMPSLYDNLQENIDILQDLTESISDQQLKSMRLDRKSRDEREKRIQTWLDIKIENAPGNTRDEKLQWLWSNDPSFYKVVEKIRILYKHPPYNKEAEKSKFYADKYYIRFGDLPENNKSMNYFHKKHEKGISVYPAKWNFKHNMWEIVTDDLSDSGMATLDSLIGDFFETDKKRNNGRPIYLLHGQESGETGIEDYEPLIDKNQIKIVKKLLPAEIWIEHYNDTIKGIVNESVLSIDIQIDKLEKEWERLDSMGNNSVKQSKITAELQKLRKQKEKSTPNYERTKHLWANLHASLNENNITSGHTYEDFINIGRLQRDEPENAMLNVQRVMGGGVLNPVVENGGDILHRMNDPNTFERAGYEYVNEKVVRVIWYLSNPYGFEREFNENIITNARYDKGPVERLRKNIDKALNEYAHEFKKLPTFNRAQKYAQNACVCIGEKRWDDALKFFKELKHHLSSEKEWKKFAHEGLVE